MLQVSNKLIVVTRKDLKPGSQIAQAIHSISQFSLEHHQIFKQWGNNYIVCLSIENENKLINLIQKLQDNQIKFSVFTEPDLGGQVTSICIEGSEKASKLTSSFPLSLKEFNNLNK